MTLDDFDWWPGQRPILDHILAQWNRNEPAVIAAGIDTGKSTIARRVAACSLDDVCFVSTVHHHVLTGNKSARVFSPNEFVMAFNRWQSTHAPDVPERFIGVDTCVIMDDVFHVRGAELLIEQLASLGCRVLAIGTPTSDTPTWSSWDHIPRFPTWVVNPNIAHDGVTLNLAYEKEASLAHVDYGCFVDRPEVATAGPVGLEDQTPRRVPPRVPRGETLLVDRDGRGFVLESDAPVSLLHVEVGDEDYEPTPAELDAVKAVFERAMLVRDRVPVVVTRGAVRVSLLGSAPSRGEVRILQVVIGGPDWIPSDEEIATIAKIFADAAVPGTAS